MDMKWYVVQTRSNYENKVMSEIPKVVEEAGISQDIAEFFSPEEPVVTFKDGVKKESKKKMYPNYVFIHAKYSEQVWHALKKINGCSGFLGEKGSPAIMPDSDIEAIKKKIETATPRPKVEYDVGARVLVKNGAFKDFYGTVDSVDYEKGRIKVNVTIFGRETGMDMELVDVELSK